MSKSPSDGNDFAFALDTETDRLKWKQPLGPQFVQDRGDGPRGSVTVDGDALYLIRGGGELHCLAAANGKLYLRHHDLLFCFNLKDAVPAR